LQAFEYRFGGSNFIKGDYKSRTNANYSKVGWDHFFTLKESEFRYKFTVLNSYSTIQKPVAYFDTSSGNLQALEF